MKSFNDAILWRWSDYRRYIEFDVRSLCFSPSSNWYWQFQTVSTMSCNYFWQIHSQFHRVGFGFCTIFRKQTCLVVSSKLSFCKNKKKTFFFGWKWRADNYSMVFRLSVCSKLKIKTIWIETTSKSKLSKLIMNCSTFSIGK